MFVEGVGGMEKETLKKYNFDDIFSLSVWQLSFIFIFPLLSISAQVFAMIQD